MVEEAAGFVAERCDVRPEAAVMTGTGLGDAAEGMDVRFAVDYGRIPHFPVSTVQSHRGRLLIGLMRGRPVAALQGRIHLYEGYGAMQVAFPVRLMRALGARTLIATNAAGGLNPRFGPGDIMGILDHVNLTGENPLVGPNVDEWGLRFPDMSRAYDPGLARTAAGIARKEGLPYRTGVYAGLKGPSLETPAEVRFLTAIGADAVGFSTVQEVIAAVHAGMRVAAFSIITNVHRPDTPSPSTVEEIIEVANRAAPGLQTLVAGLVEAIDTDDNR
jgi:purine-nucleoside phosphorylase